MATFNCEEVVSMLENESDWADSEDDEPMDTEDFTSLMNPLEILQYGSTLPSSPSHSPSSPSPPSPSSPLPPLLQSTAPPSNVSSNRSTTATPFSAPPFTVAGGPSTILHSDATPLDFFMLVFDDDIFQLLVDQTNLYASQHPPSDRYPWEDTCVSEMKLFLGIIIMMGLVQLPQMEDYWSTDNLLGAPSIVNGMPINRFKVLLSCLHINDNTAMKPRNDPQYDKLHKVRPLLTAARDNFLREYTPFRDLSIDEAMVLFKGRSSLKQYMPLKPVKRGYKVWCLCDAKNGYMSNFDVYTGAKSGNVRADGGLGASVIKQLMEPFKGLYHFVFFDNFFSSVNLALDLLEHYHTYSCGTARANRLKFPKELQKVKLDRGMSRSVVVQEAVNCIAWQDKKLVHFIDTISDPTEQTQVQRRNKDGSRSNVNSPLAAKTYNASMGGVDLADAKRTVYSCSRKSKKWWHRIFYFVIDVCVVNAHIILSETPHQSKLCQKDFVWSWPGNY